MEIDGQFECSQEFPGCEDMFADLVKHGLVDTTSMLNGGWDNEAKSIIFSNTAPVQSASRKRRAESFFGEEDDESFSPVRPIGSD